MIASLAVLFQVFESGASAAVGCDLNDPDRDVKRLFPGSTGYKTEYLSVDRIGGKTLLKEIEDRLGDSFQGIYETIDVPYTVYTIYKGKEIAGYIHGINQKGLYGGLQVFLVYDTKGTVINFYFQKLTSKKAAEMRSPNFAKQFAGLTLADFKDYDPKTGKSANAKITSIKNPNPDDPDFNSTLRAVKKNFILMDIFVFNKKESVK